VLAACALGAVVQAPPAEAHASLLASSPAELDILTAPPGQVMLVFDEDVEPELSAVLVTGPSGTPLQVGALGHGRFGKSYLTADLSGPAPAGDYTVTWRVLSPDDGHTTGGGFSYRTTIAGTAKPGARVIDPAATPGTRAVVGAIYGTARWTAFLGFALLAGGGYFLVACGPIGATRRALRLIGAGGIALLVSTALALLTYGPQAEGSSLSGIVDRQLLTTTLSTHTGHLLLLRLGLLGGLAGVAVVVARSSRRGRHVTLPQGRRSLVLATAAALATTWSFASHSASSAHPLPLMALDVAHLVACAVWLGGLVALGAAVLPDTGSGLSRLAARRFSSTAAVCVAVLVVSGSVQAWQRVGSPAALLDNEYALLLLGKLGLVWLTLLLAGVARFRVLRLPAFDVSALRRVVIMEAGLAVAVLTVTSVLVTTEPARTAHAERLAAQRREVPAQVRPAALVTQPLSGQAAYDGGGGASSRGVVEMSVVSPHVGPSEVHITIVDAAGRARPVTELVVALKPPAGPQQAVTVQRLSTGHFVSSGARFSAPGAWRLGVALRLPSGAGALVTFGVEVS
jgi:copper transport protein